MFLLLLLQTSYASNLTSSPLPTTGVIQSWTPNISYSTMPSQTITVSQSFSSQPDNTYSPQYTISPSFTTSFSPPPSQTSETITAPNSKVSIYDTLTVKTGIGVGVGLILIAMFICTKYTSPANPLFLGQTNPILSSIQQVNKTHYTDIVTGKLLADGWKSTTDETGDVWYVNIITGESSWTAKYKE